MPLYEIAINKGLYPVSKFIERHYIDDDQRNFFTEWNDAFTEQYISGDICRSEQQDALIKFFEKKYNNTISISAPTSYGKSELILSTIKEYKGRKICVLTSTKALLTQTKKRRIEGDNIFLMGSTRLYGYNKEYYSFALCCMLECLGKYSVRYEDAKGWEDIHHQIEVTEKSTGEVYEIKYRRSDKKFSIYKKDGSATVYANLEDTFNALK